ncbi:MAG: 3-deoxy-manno-octulosonate cytidylyltransferase [Gammaproteobacteria bacterium]|nr:3-deoxy-manno-octulosonate cytidylyltransferase [Gammaproteobacteria bacterium]
MDYTVVIPARYASTRLPGKPLLEIAGKPLLQHVWEKARGSSARAVLIATDDERIASVARGFGAEVCLSSSAHRSGSDRICEAIEGRALPDDAHIVNLQGDEPLLPSCLLDQVAAALETRSQADMATLCAPLEPGTDAADPNLVKVVRDNQGRALYFSRCPIPHGAPRHWRHIGLYAYRAGYLRRFVRLPPCAAERDERLEQLRALHHGAWIHVELATAPVAAGVDTAADLQRVRELFRAQIDA